MNLKDSLRWIESDDPFYYDDEDKFRENLIKQIEAFDRTLSYSEWYRHRTHKAANNLFHFMEYGQHYWSSWNGHCMDIFWTPADLNPLIGY